MCASIQLMRAIINLRRAIIELMKPWNNQWYPQLLGFVLFQNNTQLDSHTPQNHCTFTGKQSRSKLAVVVSSSGHLIFMSKYVGEDHLVAGTCIQSICMYCKIRYVQLVTCKQLVFVYEVAQHCGQTKLRGCLLPHLRHQLNRWASKIISDSPRRGLSPPPPFLHRD